MAKKKFKQTTKPMIPQPAAKQAAPAYPVEREDLEEQTERVRKAAAAGASALKPAAPASATVKQSPVNVTFAVSKADAKRVSLCGEFNGWSPNATPMKRHDDGHWETTIGLSPGQYQYKFLVDEEWIPDPTAQKNVRNQYGSLNSVLEVRA